eukprot:jgi/Chrzof1/11230/Cz05g28250.t1
MFWSQQGKAPDPGRRATRQRKVSQRMAVVDESTRQQAAQARLDALENDNNEAQDVFGMDEEDEEFTLVESEEEEQEYNRKSKKRKVSGGKGRKTRGKALDKAGPKTFSRLLEEVGSLFTVVYATT